MQGCIRRVCTEFCKDVKQYKHTQHRTLRELGSVRCFCGDGWNGDVGGSDPSVSTAERQKLFSYILLLCFKPGHKAVKLGGADIAADYLSVTDDEVHYNIIKSFSAVVCVIAYSICILHGSFALVQRQVKAAFLLQCVIVFIDIAEHGGDNYVADGFAVA